MKYKVGDIIVAQVTSIKSYGAFLSLDNHFSGLLHVSEISHEYVSDVSKVFKIGDKIKVKITSIDEKTKQIIVSRKVLLTNNIIKKNKIKKNKEKVEETKNGFVSLEKMLPYWIENYDGGHYD